MDRRRRGPRYRADPHRARGIFALADLVVCLVDKRRRSLHDHLAGTVVVEE